MSIYLVRESVYLTVATSRLNKLMKLISFNMTCMWTFHANSLLHGYLFLMHVHK